MKEKYEKKYDIPERILFMALESVLYDEEQANNLITTMIEDDLKRQKVKALVKTSLLVSSSDCYLDLLLILYLSNSTNLQILRRQCNAVYFGDIFGVSLTKISRPRRPRR